MGSEMCIRDSTKGITADAKYIGTGSVAIIGKFGDETHLRTILGNSVLGEIDGLEQTIINNRQAVVASTSPKQPQSDLPRIKKIVRGDDPHLVSEDHRMYYSGAIVPGIGQFIGIEDGKLKFEVNDQLTEFLIVSDLPAKLEPVTTAPTNYFNL